MKQATFTSLAGWGLKAEQKKVKASQDSSIVLSDRDQALATAWETMEQNWDNLLHQYGIHNPGNRERFSKMKDLLPDKISPYEKFVSHLVRFEAYTGKNRRNMLQKANGILSFTDQV